MTVKKNKPNINQLKNLILIVLNKEGANLSDVDSLWEKKYINKMQKYAQTFPDSFNDAII